MKTDSTTTAYLCPICEEGEMTLQRQEFETSTEGDAVVVPDVEMEICSNCQEMVLTPAGSRQVSEYVEKVAGAITNEELETFLRKYQLT